MHGTFDLVHCHGVLYHEPHPMAMLERLRSMLAPGGTMFLGSMMLASPELSEYARFVPGAYYGDRDVVVGARPPVPALDARDRRPARSHDLFGVHDGPPGEFPVVNGYFRTTLP